MTHRRMLLVEDEPGDAERTLETLCAWRIATERVVVHDGAATGASANRHPHLQPHVVFLDLTLPTRSGLEVVERLRALERAQALPVILLISSVEERARCQRSHRVATRNVTTPRNAAPCLAAVYQRGLTWLLVRDTPSGGVHTHEGP